MPGNANFQTPNSLRSQNTIWCKIRPSITLNETLDAGGGSQAPAQLPAGLTAAAGCLVMALFCRLLFRWGNQNLHVPRASSVQELRDSARDERRRRRAHVRLAIAWLVAWVLYAGCTWTVVAYARCFEKEESDGLLIDWLASIGISFLLTEPVQIVAIACMPCIFKAECIQGCMDRMKDAGMDCTLISF